VKWSQKIGALFVYRTSIALTNVRIQIVCLFVIDVQIFLP